MSRFQVFLLIFLFAAPLASAADVGALSPDVERVLKWLPEDTETLVVAQSFQLPDEETVKKNAETEMLDLTLALELFALGEIPGPDEGKSLKPLFGQKIKLALCGSRNYEIVSAFGSLRSESCSIIVFEEGLGDTGGQWKNMVRKAAKEIRQLKGHEVFVYSSPTVMEGSFELKPWQGAFLVWLKADTLLCASSDRYLSEVLTRIDSSPKERALPNSLAEWKYVDSSASGWMLRRVPAGKPRRVVEGVVCNLMKDRFVVVYLPTEEGRKDILKAVTTRWTPPSFPDPKIPPLNAKADKIEQRTDGSVAVSIPANKLALEAGFWFGMQIYHVQREDGLLGAR